MSGEKPVVVEFEKCLLLEIFNYINERLKENELHDGKATKYNSVGNVTRRYCLNGHFDHKLG
jgi:hypothetical protein